jgi:hypothetical protein
MRSLRRAVVLATFTGAVILVPAAASQAAPIDCPSGQTVTKTASGWDCVNNAGHTNNSEDPKNPNAGKGFF